MTTLPNSCKHGEWQETQLGSVVALKRGYDLPAHRRRPGSVPVVSSSGITDYHAESMVTGPGVVTGRSGTLGQVFFLPGDYWPLNTTLYVQDFKGNDPRFVSYLLQGINFAAYSDKSAVPGLNRNDLHQEPVRIPTSVARQRAIAHVLGTLDDKIELNRRMNATLEATVRALFKSWFVDFEPVRAKLEGRDTGLPAPIADLFPERITGSDSRPLPEGWRQGTLHDLAALNPESWSSRRRPETLSYVDLANTKWGYLESVEFFRWDEAPSRARRVLRRGDTIMATVRPGNGSFALVDEEGLTGSTGFAVLRPRAAADRALVWCAVTAADNLDRLSWLADGAAYPAVRPAEVAATPVAVADSATRAEFSRQADPLLDKIESNKRESRRLRLLRDELQARLLSGKLQLGEGYPYR